MPLPDPHSVCFELQVDLELLQLHIDLPGGAKLSLPQLRVPDAGDVTGKLLVQANAALAPLVPVFRIIDVVIALGEFASAVPGVVFSPGKLVDALTKLLVKISVVGSLIPQLAIPRTLKSIIGALVAYLSAIRAQLQALIDQQAKIEAAAELAVQLGSGHLQVSVECARVSLDAQLDAINEGLAPLNELLGLVNLIGGLAGLPKVPTAISFGNDAEAALAPLDAAINALRTLQAAIPIP